MAYCTKYKSWSGASHFHTTSFYNMLPYLLDPIIVTLALIHSMQIVLNLHHHKWHQKCNSSPVLNTVTSVLKGGLDSNNDPIQVSISKANQVLYTFQTSIHDVVITVLVVAFGNALGFNLLNVLFLVDMCPIFQIKTHLFWFILVSLGFSMHMLVSLAFYSIFSPKNTKNLLFIIDNHFNLMPTNCHWMTTYLMNSVVLEISTFTPSPAQLWLPPESIFTFIFHPAFESPSKLTLL